MKKKQKKELWIFLAVIAVVIIATIYVTRGPKEIVESAPVPTGAAVAEPTGPVSTPTETTKPDIELVPVQSSKLKTEYDNGNYYDCGVYVRRNNDVGAQGDYIDLYRCFRQHHNMGESAKAYIDVQTQEGARVVSSLVTRNGKITNHIKGNDPYGYAGEDLKNCDSIHHDLALQYTCIGYVNL